MERYEKIIAILFIAGLITVLGWSVVQIFAYAHESHGFTHMEGSSGSITGQRYCGDGTIVWFQDLDEDGELDTCTRVIFTHEKIHIRRSLPVDETCSCNVEGEGR